MSSFAIGGEDQVGVFLCRVLSEMGHNVSLFSEHESPIIESKKFDLIISNGARTKVDCDKSVFWHFNERSDLVDVGHIVNLGYTHLATNQTIFSDSQKKSLRSSGIQWFHLPLAADASMVSPAWTGEEKFDSQFAYIGNWNTYKGDRIEEWLDPIRHDLCIFGGTKWSQHPTLSKCYRGIYPPEKWSDLSRIAPVWISFRSPQQALWGMIPDRIYWLMAAGVRCIVSDMPKDSNLSDAMGELVEWIHCDQVGKYSRLNINRSNRYREFVSNGNLYSDRIRTLMEKVL